VCEGDRHSQIDISCEARVVDHRELPAGSRNAKPIEDPLVTRVATPGKLCVATDRAAKQPMSGALHI
jgi:hypothetical protein